jgi:L-threonylcarbamoyladenylate synthase
VDGAAPDPEALSAAVRVLASGGLVIFPTDTLYALGGRALDPGAAARVREAKGRAERKPLPLVAADREQARGLSSAWPPAADRLADHFWPGPLTVVVPAAPGVPVEVTAGSGTVAVRVPALAVTRRLCEGAGPLISTSANRAGEPPSRTCADAVAAVGGQAALALDAGPGQPAASTIVDLTGATPRLLREGAVPWSEVEGVLRGPGG